MSEENLIPGRLLDINQGFWTSAKEQLPEEGHLVLVVLDNWMTTLAIYGDGQWTYAILEWEADTELEGLKVVYWMSVPTNPREGYNIRSEALDADMWTYRDHKNVGFG